MAGIYFHIPFCKQACHYCDFHFSTNLDLRTDLVSALGKELSLQQNYLGGEEIETIYFGGGTPSLLSVKELEDIFNHTQANFSVSSNAEITIEANPDDLDSAKLEGLLRTGFNRLSIGIQAFQDNILRFLNRAHDSKAAIDCVSESRRAGFQNISIDLIYAIPGFDDGLWLENVQKAIDLNPDHISAYSLTIEPKTVFGAWSKKGKIVPASEETSAHHLEQLVSILQRAGYQQYEVSNFCKAGFESKHNSSYWQRKKYLGIGPSAHSYNGHSRQYNVRNNHVYTQSLLAGNIPFEREILSREDQVNEYLMTTLRTSWGTDLSYLTKEFDYDIISSHRLYIQQLVGVGLASVENNILKLTPHGKMMADKISADLFLI